MKFVVAAVYLMYLNSPVEPRYIELSGEALKQRKFEIAATPASKSKLKGNDFECEITGNLRKLSSN